MRLFCPVCGSKLNISKKYLGNVFICKYCESSLYIDKKYKKPISFELADPSVDMNVEDIEF